MGVVIRGLFVAGLIGSVTAQAAAPKTLPLTIATLSAKPATAARAARRRGQIGRAHV